MRVDDKLPLAVVPFQLLARSGADGQVFADVLSSRDGETEAKLSSEPRRHLFSFDALGVLGLGALSAQGKDVPVAARKIVTQSLASRMDGKANLAPSMLGQAVVTPVPAGEVEPQILAVKPVGAAVTETSALSGAIRGAVGMSPAMPLQPAASPLVPSDLPEVQEPVLANAAPNRTGVSSTSGEVREASARAAAFKARFSSASEAAADRANNDISVTVSATDGTVHVLAAASGLGEDARTKLRGLAQTIAQDAGLALGEFSLNGASLPDFPYLIRSSSWLYPR